MPSEPHEQCASANSNCALENGYHGHDCTVNSVAEITSVASPDPAQFPPPSLSPRDSLVPEQKRSRLSTNPVAIKALSETIKVPGNSSPQTKTSELAQGRHRSTGAHVAKPIRQIKDFVRTREQLTTASSIITFKVIETGVFLQVNTTSSEEPAPRPKVFRNRRIILDEDDEIKAPTSYATIPLIKRDPSESVASSFPPPDTERMHCVSKQALAPQPRHEYTVPKELQGVRIALGADNWNQYLLLMEQLWLDEIGGEEFAAESKQMFMVIDNATRKRMNNLVAMTMVLPMLQKYESKDRLRSEEVMDVISST